MTSILTNWIGPAIMVYLLVRAIVSLARIVLPIAVFVLALSIAIAHFTGPTEQVRAQPKWTKHTLLDQHKLMGEFNQCYKWVC